MNRLISRIFYIGLLSFLSPSVVSAAVPAFEPFLSETLRSDTSGGAATLSGGPLSILFIGQYDTVGDAAVNIAGRFDCLVETIYTDSRVTLGNGSIGESVGSTIVEALKKPWQAIWLDFSVSSLPGNAAEVVRKAVVNGAGLIYIGDSKDIDRWKTGALRDGDPIKALSYAPFKPEVIGLAGKGRLVTVPMVETMKTARDREDYYAGAAACILYASGVNTGMIIRAVSFPRNIEFEGMHLLDYRIDIVNETKTRPVTVHCRYRSTSNKVVEDVSEVYTINEGKTFLMINFPLLPIDTYSVDVSLEDESGLLASSGATFTVTAVNKITAVDLWAPFMSEGGAIPGLIKFYSDIEEGWVVTVELRDCYSRILGVEEPQLVIKRRTAPFSFLLNESSGTILTVRVNFFKNHELLQVVERPIYVRKPYDPQSFLLAVNSEEGNDPLSAARRRALITAGTQAFGVNMAKIPPHAMYERLDDLSSDRAIIIPILNNPFYNKNTDRGNETTVFRALVDTLRYIDPPAFFLSPPPDGDDIAAFSRYLAGRHSAIDPLNDAWGVSAGSFDEAAKKALASAEGFTKPVIRLDTGLFLHEETYTAGREAAHCVASSDSSIGIAVLNPGKNGHVWPVFNAFRWKNIVSGTISSLATDTAMPFDPILSFNTSRRVRFLAFDPVLAAGDSTAVRMLPWKALFSGMNGLWRTRGITRFHNPLTPAGLPSPAFGTVAVEVALIRSGFDKLVTGSEPVVNTRIGVLYNPLSNAAAVYTSNDDTGSTSDGERPLRSALQLFRDIGINPLLVAEEQLGIEWPVTNRSILFLPDPMAVTDDLAGRLQRFVEEGGTLIVDHGTGVYDERLAVRNEGALSRLFGLTSGGGGESTEPTGSLSIVKDGLVRLDQPIMSVMSDPSVVTAHDSHTVVYGKSGAAPALIVNSHGEGKTLFLNLDISRYEPVQFSRDGEGIRRIVENSITQLSPECIGGVTAGVFDTGNERVPWTDTFVFRDGDLYYIGVLTAPAAPAISKPVSLKIDGIGRQHVVYDVFNGAVVGIPSGCPFTIVPGGVNLYAVIPYRVQRMTISFDSPIARIGQKFVFTASIDTGTTAVSLGRHVFRLEVLGPDNAVKPYFSKTVIANGGSYEGALYFALNDDTGKWTIRVTDVATGRSAEKIVMLTSAKSDRVR